MLLTLLFSLFFYSLLRLVPPNTFGENKKEEEKVLVSERKKEVTKPAVLSLSHSDRGHAERGREIHRVTAPHLKTTFEASVLKQIRTHMPRNGLWV